MNIEQESSSAGSSSGSGVRDELSNDAARLKDTAQARVKEEAETRMGQAVRAAGSASSALEKAAGELDQDDNAPQWLSSAVRQAATGIERLAGELDGRSPDEIVQQVSSFARRSPGTFLAASAAVGFAAARVLRAGADHRAHSSGQGASTGSGEDYDASSYQSYGSTGGEYGSSSSSGYASGYASGSSTTEPTQPAPIYGGSTTGGPL